MEGAEKLALISNEFEIAKSRKEGTPSSVGVLSIQSAKSALTEASMQENPKELFHSLWFEHEIFCLFADSNVGKSILAYQIAIQIAKSQKVIYFDFELSKKQLQLRYTDDNGDMFEFPPNLLRSELNPDKLADAELSFEDAVIGSIRDAALACNAKVLIIDNISILCSQSEKGEDAAALIRNLRTLKNQFGFSILVIAHTPKRNMSMKINQNDLAGSKKIFNFIDSSFAIGKSVKGNNIRYIKQIKVRNCEEVYGEDNVLVCRVEKDGAYLQFVEMGTSPENDHLKAYDKDSDIETAHQLKSEGYSVRQIAAKMGISKSTADRLLHKTLPKSVPQSEAGQLGQSGQQTEHFEVSQLSHTHSGTVQKGGLP